jgi:hypothetical protein
LTNIDEFSIFGQIVASQLRKLNRRNRAIAKNYIQNYLFDMEMREMNSVPLDTPSPNLSYSVTSSTSSFPGSSPQSCQSVNSDYSNTMFLKLWSADHKWSSGSALVVLLDWTLVQKRQKKLTWIAYHTIVENLRVWKLHTTSFFHFKQIYHLKKKDKFAFKGEKSRVVRRTFWLIKVVPTWKKFEKRCSNTSTN